MYLDISIGRGLAKFFKGKREDIDDWGKVNNLKEQFAKGKNFRKRLFLYKNPASIAVAKLKNVSFKFNMRESGGKIMKLIVEKINLADFR